jgi:glycosyltransferase involved in cell wall biosynthesis
VRVAQVATLATPVSRVGSGSIEAIVWHLAKGLVDRGHEVTVFAAGGSTPPAGVEFVATLPAPYGAEGVPEDWQLAEWENVALAVAQSGRFDVVHSHNYLWGLPLEPLSAAPMVHTLHLLPYEDSRRLVHLHPEATITAVSEFQWSGVPDVRPAAVVHHGIDPSEFTFRPDPEDYVCYLGRFLPAKGVLTAVDAARRMGVPIVLAGPRDDYFDTQVAPLVDGEQVRYAGTVFGAGRDALLGGARALLYPIASPEPFGLVLPEAMMCGTPVVATAVGAVPELVDDGVTGALMRDPSRLDEAIRCAFALDRADVRSCAVERFHLDRMVDGYERVFEQVTRR